MRVLILGVAGSMGRKVATRLLLLGHEVSGIDARPFPNAPKNIDFVKVDIRKRGAEDVFRKKRPEVVVHMATVTSLQIRGEERHRINLGGTRTVFEHCRKYGVEHCVFVGRHTYYGAGPDSPMFHTEDEAPMALATFPELSDLVAADLYATTSLWRFPDLVTSVLRMVYTLGPSPHGTLAAYLKGPVVPTVLGFDPLFHVLHEDDVVEAITLAVQKRLRGVFNVAGPPPLPLSVVIRETGRRNLPLPETVSRFALGKFGLPRLSAGALAHIKFPIVVDASRFEQATGFSAEHDTRATLAAYRGAFPLPR